MARRRRAALASACCALLSGGAQRRARHTASSSGSGARRSATRRPPATGAAVTAGVLQLARLASRARRCQVVCLWTSYFGPVWRSACDMRFDAAAHSFLLKVRVARPRGPEEENRRVFGADLGRVRTQPIERPRPKSCCLHRPLLAVQSAHHRGIRQARSCSILRLHYHISATRWHDSQGAERCKLGAIHCSASLHKHAASGKHEPCVASSRSQPSQAPRPT